MLPTIIITTLIAIVFVLIVLNGIRNKKRGKHSCSCGGRCGSCGMSGLCHGNKMTDAEN